MKKKLLLSLYDNRLMKNDREFEMFDMALDSLSELIDEDDIVSLVSILDDNTEGHEVMFRLVHLIESYVYSEKSYLLLLEGISCIVNNTPEWSRILMYRILNDEHSRKKISKILKDIDNEMYNKINELLMNICAEDSNLFRDKINDIIQWIYIKTKLEYYVSSKLDNSNGKSNEFDTG